MFHKPNMPSGAVPPSLEVIEHILRQAIENAAQWTDEERVDYHYALNVVIANARLKGQH